MTEVIGVKFYCNTKLYYFDPAGEEFTCGERIVVETARGIELGRVLITNRMVEDDDVVQPLKPIIRKATDEDIENEKKNKAKEPEAFRICKEKIQNHGLIMKLVAAEYTFDGSKVLFYFTADGRVDFRELVKDLASTFRTRIELRQIGVRDEAKIKGGIGKCGRELCCNSYLTDFVSVSIKMAKEQNLSLNPTKISGSCGRLMCCLKNEEETYELLNSCLPSVGDAVVVKEDGKKGIVQSVNVLRQKVRVLIKDAKDDETEAIDYDAEGLLFEKGRRTFTEPEEQESGELRELEKLEELEKAEKAEEELEGGQLIRDKNRERRGNQKRDLRQWQVRRSRDGQGAQPADGTAAEDVSEKPEREARRNGRYDRERRESRGERRSDNDGYETGRTGTEKAGEEGPGSRDRNENSDHRERRNDRRDRDRNSRRNDRRSEGDGSRSGDQRPVTDRAEGAETSDRDPGGEPRERKRERNYKDRRDRKNYRRGEQEDGQPGETEKARESGADNGRDLERRNDRRDRRGPRREKADGEGGMAQKEQDGSAAYRRENGGQQSSDNAAHENE